MLQKRKLHLLGIAFLACAGLLALSFTASPPKTIKSENLNAITTQAGSYKKKLNIEHLSKPRALGNPDAPLKIVDYSSYTCGACGYFHLASFDKIKEDYIDTGKVYFVFEDFPRNEHDVEITAIAHCIPEKDYFNFVTSLYKTQEKWMRNKDFLTFIKQNAKLTGADPKIIEQCAQSKDLKDAIAKRGQYAYKNIGIKSTPTFIINDDKRLVGALPYESFKKVLDKELSSMSSSMRNHN